MKFKVWDKVKFLYNSWSPSEKPYYVEWVIEEAPKNPTDWGHTWDFLWVRIDLVDIDWTDAEQSEDCKNSTGAYRVNVEELKLINYYIC